MCVARDGLASVLRLLASERGVTTRVAFEKRAVLKANFKDDRDGSDDDACCRSQCCCCARCWALLQMRSQATLLLEETWKPVLFHRATAYVVFHVFAADALNAATALCESDAGRRGFGSHWFAKAQKLFKQGWFSYVFIARTLNANRCSVALKHLNARTCQVGHRFHICGMWICSSVVGGDLFMCFRSNQVQFRKNGYAVRCFAWMGARRRPRRCAVRMVLACLGSVRDCQDTEIKGGNITESPCVSLTAIMSTMANSSLTAT